jgi:hypothetical protein
MKSSDVQGGALTLKHPTSPQLRDSDWKFPFDKLWNQEAAASTWTKSMLLVPQPLQMKQLLPRGTARAQAPSKKGQRGARTETINLELLNLKSTKQCHTRTYKQ